jgi:hypothetical protein
MSSPMKAVAAMSLTCTSAFQLGMPHTTPSTARAGVVVATEDEWGFRFGRGQGPATLSGSDLGGAGHAEPGANVVKTTGDGFNFGNGAVGLYSNYNSGGAGHAEPESTSTKSTGSDWAFGRGAGMGAMVPTDTGGAGYAEPEGANTKSVGGEAIFGHGAVPSDLYASYNSGGAGWAEPSQYKGVTVEGKFEAAAGKVVPTPAPAAKPAAEPAAETVEA